MAEIMVITSNIAPYRLAWCEELAKHFDVSIVYTKDHDFERDDRWLRNSSKSCRLIKLDNKGDIYDPLCFEVIDVLKKNRDALVIFDGYGPKTNLLGLLYCKLTGRFSYVNVDGYPTERKRSALKDIVKRFVISHLCKAFTCGSQKVKEHLMSYGAGDEDIIIHGLSSIRQEDIIAKPLSKKQKLELRKELGIAYEGDIVLGTGRFLPLKRFDDLIKAVKKCQRPCHLYLLGGKPLDEYLEIADERIHFIDFVEPEKVKDYYRAADLFVLPSETDVWGLVLNEAMAQGLPIIASDSVIAAYSLIRDNGFMFKTYDIDELAEDIGKCLDENNRQEMAAKSLELIGEYTIEKMVSRQLPYFKAYFEKEK